MILKHFFKRKLPPNKGILIHDFCQVWKENVWILILGVSIFCVLMPVSTAAIAQTSIFNVNYTHDQLKFRFYADSVLPLLNLSIVGFSGLLGINLFRFLLEKGKIAVLFALGIKREKLFLIRFFAGSVMLSLAMIGPLCISLLLNLAALGAYPGIGQYFLANCIGFLLQGFVVMLICCLACCVAGTLAESLLLAISIMAAPTVILYGTGAIIKHFLWGSVLGKITYTLHEVAPSLLELTRAGNPILFFYRGMEKYGSFYREMELSHPLPVEKGLLAVWFLIVVLLFLIAQYAVHKRKAEHAGISGLSTSINILVPLVFSLAMASLCMEYVGQISIPLALLGGFFCFFLCHMLFFKRTYRPHADWRKDLRIFCIELGALGILIGIFASGGFGYSQRIPALDLVKQCEISYVGTPCYLTTQPKGSSFGSSYYLAYDVSFHQSDDIEQVQQLHKKLIAMKDQDRKEGQDDQEEAVIPYDMSVSYHLNNGHTLTRYYDRVSVSILAEMLSLDDTMEMKQRVSAAITGTAEQQVWAAEAFQQGKIYFSDIWYDRPKEVELSSEKRQELLQAIQLDVEKQTAKERYFSQTPPLGVIMFSQNGENDTKQFAYEMSNTFIYVTEAFQNTKLLLEQWGLNDIFTFHGEVEKILLQKFDPNMGINAMTNPFSYYFMAYRSAEPDQFMIRSDFGKNPQITEEEKIRELSSRLRNDYFMSGGGYLAAVKIKGKDQYVYKFLPAESAPDGIREKM